ncbi:MAG TPA: exonuclease domain-containing protein [Longimicrobiales bacterium]|nr:exonuclease domain-containing protein [Longimicrobiales bacterium]
MSAVQLDLLQLLPPELVGDASDRSRGIRVSLRAAPAPRTVLLEHPDDELRRLEYVVVDLETTGGSAYRGHRITEFAAVRMRGNGEVIDEFSTLVNPLRRIPPFITALTRITSEMVAGAPLFHEIVPQVRRILEGAVFVAHNAGFDHRFLSAELSRLRVPLLGRKLCTVRLARRTVPEIGSRSLDSLAYFFNIENPARHRAFGDARATAVLLGRLLDRLEDQEVRRWHELETLLRRRPRRRRKRVASPQPMDVA